MSYGNVFKHELLFNKVIKYKINMALPELIYAPIDGGTIHRYEISGGKRKFLRFIGCYLGQCNFHKNIDDAIDYIKNLKESQKIQKKWNKDILISQWLNIFQEPNNYCYK